MHLTDNIELLYEKFLTEYCRSVINGTERTMHDYEVLSGTEKSCLRREHGDERGSINSNGSYSVLLSGLKLRYCFVT